MLIFVVVAVVVRSRLGMTLSNPRTIAVAEEDIITRHVLRRCSLHADLHALIVFAHSSPILRKIEALGSKSSPL